MEQLKIIRAFLRMKGHGTAENNPHFHSHEDALMRDEMAVAGVSTVVPDPNDIDNFVAQFEQARADMTTFAQNALDAKAAADAEAEAFEPPKTKAKKK